MGTTCSALLLQDNKGIIGHVGDSRIYRIVKNSIEQLTDDHSTVAEMQRRGILTEEEARVHPERSHLYRALGVRPEMEIDVMHDISLGMNELFLLCTDGLVNHVEDDEICRIVLQYRPDGAVRKLVDLANERGGSDNITVEVLHVNPTESFMQRVFNKRP
jgi:protein phosphatase